MQYKPADNKAGFIKVISLEGCWSTYLQYILESNSNFVRAFLTWIIQKYCEMVLCVMYGWCVKSTTIEDFASPLISVTVCENILPHSLHFFYTALLLEKTSLLLESDLLQTVTSSRSLCLVRLEIWIQSSNGGSLNLGLNFVQLL